MNRLIPSCSILLMLLTGCSLLKKTSNTTTADTRQLEKKSNFNMLELKSANKQTSIFTLWDSGRIYQHQLILEQTDESTLAGLKTTEQDTAKKEVVTRKTMPPDLWIYTGLIVFLIGAYWMYRKVSAAMPFNAKHQ